MNTNAAIKKGSFNRKYIIWNRLYHEKEWITHICYSCTQHKPYYKTKDN